jgi:hypothetical protein
LKKINLATKKDDKEAYKTAVTAAFHLLEDIEFHPDAKTFLQVLHSLNI